jgi:hypothetical protein
VCGEMAMRKGEEEKRRKGEEEKAFPLFRSL